MVEHNNKRFHSDDLQLVDWLHTVRHHNTDNFKRGDRVFLKSNPECALHVYFIGPDKVSVMWYDNNGILQFAEFPPECILQYKYAGLMVYRRSNIKISLN